MTIMVRPNHMRPGVADLRTPLVSVIMPAYNGELYVVDAIRSVLSQSMSDLELIVVNDGSTDSTLALVEDARRSDDRLRVINRKHSGRPSLPKNDGLAAARGRYISFLDCDDLYDPERIAWLVAGLQSRPDWVAAFHDLRLIEGDGSVIPGTYLSDVDFLQRAAAHLTALGGGWYESKSSFYVFQSLFYAAMHTQSVMIAADRFGRGSLTFDPRFIICEDTDLWIRLGRQGAIGYLDRVLSSYRQHGSSLTANMEKRCNEMVKMHTLNYSRIGARLSRRLAREYRKKIAGLAADLGYVRFRRYDLAGARAAYAEALRWQWSAPFILGVAKACLPVKALQRIHRASQ